jgi:prepilin-type N-terminal cleavage/methylation domain-containing protein/prepilin-type processing-associated H-X9-DG protein
MSLRRLHQSKEAGAFTLLELLVVIVILVILAALSSVFINQSMEMARRAQCMSNLRQIGVATYGYAGDHGGMLPIAGFSPNYPSGSCVNPDLYGFDPKEKGIVYLIPYLGASGVTDTEAEKDCARIFFCPSNRDMTFENSWAYHETRGCSYVQYCGWWYAGLNGSGYFINSPKSLRDPARQLLFTDLACDQTPTFCNHRDAQGHFTGSNCLFVDGHVEWFDKSKLTVHTYELVPGAWFFPDTN